MIWPDAWSRMARLDARLLTRRVDPMELVSRTDPRVAPSWDGPEAQATLSKLTIITKMVAIPIFRLTYFISDSPRENQNLGTASKVRWLTRIGSRYSINLGHIRRLSSLCEPLGPPSGTIVSLRVG